MVSGNKGQRPEGNRIAEPEGRVSICHHISIYVQVVPNSPYILYAITINHLSIPGWYGHRAKRSGEYGCQIIMISPQEAGCLIDNLIALCNKTGNRQEKKDNGVLGAYSGLSIHIYM